MTVAPELPPASVARRTAGSAGPRRRRSVLRAVPAPVLPTARPAEEATVRRAGPGTRQVPAGRVGDGAVQRTVLERRELRPGTTVLVERTLVERPGAAPLVLEEVVELAAPAGRWAATLDEAVERHPAGRRLAGRAAGPVGLVAVPQVDAPAWAADQDDPDDREPGTGAGREHRPAAPGRPTRTRPSDPGRSTRTRPSGPGAPGRPARTRPGGATGFRPEGPGSPAGTRAAGARVVRSATPRLRLSRRGRAAVVLLWIAAAVVLLVVAAGRVQDLTGPSPVPASAPAEVTVAPGETLWTIAERVAPASDPRDVVTEIRRLNDLDSATVRTGQTLRLHTP